MHTCIYIYIYVCLRYGVKQFVPVSEPNVFILYIYIYK